MSPSNVTHHAYVNVVGIELRVNDHVNGLFTVLVEIQPGSRHAGSLGVS